MSAYPNRIHVVPLDSGETVRLPEWHGLAPPVHGETLQRTRYNPKTDERPQFYASTSEWMRNEGAFETLPSEDVTHRGKATTLFFFEKTNTWHTADALDIDHIDKWRDHLAAKGVDNRADAARAYNDIDNLRAVPSVYNRARDSADALVAKHGTDSPEWRGWVEKRLGFDPHAEYPAFDPERDLARRTKATTGQRWTDEHTRSDLGFDTKVLDKWFNHALSEAHVGAVTVDNPKTHKKDEVHLFQCAATGQLVTRDALDIDHEIPFELVSAKMRELFPKHVITKADMLDVYNDTSNLRLVSRAANSSHEFEIGMDGQWRDKVAPEKSGEFDKFIAKGPSLDEQATALIKEHFSRESVRMPKESDGRVINMLIPRRVDEPDNLQPQPLAALAKADAALTRPDSPYHATYNKVATAVDALSESDPQFFGKMKYFLNDRNPSPGHVENIATTLIAAAKEGGMTRIDAIVTNEARTSLFAIQGNGSGEVVNRVEVPLRGAMQWTVEENTERVLKADRTALQQSAASMELSQAQKTSQHM